MPLPVAGRKLADDAKVNTSWVLAVEAVAAAQQGRVHTGTLTALQMMSVSPQSMVFGGRGETGGGRTNLWQQMQTRRVTDDRNVSVGNNAMRVVHAVVVHTANRRCQVRPFLGRFRLRDGMHQICLQKLLQQKSGILKSHITPVILAASVVVHVVAISITNPSIAAEAITGGGRCWIIAARVLAVEDVVRARVNWTVSAGTWATLVPPRVVSWDIEESTKQRREGSELIGKMSGCLGHVYRSSRGLD